jgi:hypothetical protein
MKNLLILILLISTSNLCSANNSFSETKISKLILHDNGTAIIIGLTSPLVTLEACSNKNELVLKKDHPLFNEMYAAILSAFHANTKFQGWVNGCYPSWGMPVLTRMDFLK